MENKLVPLRQLDRYCRSFNVGDNAEALPKQGWLRLIRKSLGMTIKQLAKRLRCDPSRVVKIEMSEDEGAVTLRTMRMVAEKLNCHFTYQILPKTSFEKIIKNRARDIATKIIKQTAHANLEMQKEFLEEEIADMTHELLYKSWKNLWEE
ncbi:MAG TPA: mobile mystery protein A [Coxiellaceae bacterium]|nr:MAG: transcriptional regulator [Gammaproteobacteria bacterium RIFCSPHIGHO2_12_FULL_36_30]HLB55926.1 mobile mystery protein A [Coxiellaceae bacterium]